LVIILLFYFLALLQNSFFTHFNLLGSVPNLVFILFFLLVFFEKKKKNYLIIPLAIVAGLFLDIFSYTYIGPSIVLLIIIGIVLKKIQSLLKNREDNYPFVYFLPLFLICFAVYEALLMISLHFFDLSHTLINFDLRFAAGIVYSLFFAIIGFWIFKKHAKKIQN